MNPRSEDPKNPALTQQALAGLGGGRLAYVRSIRSENVRTARRSC
jgi:hypothetical protein